jgi:hypothetical protein
VSSLYSNGPNKDFVIRPYQKLIAETDTLFVASPFVTLTGGNGEEWGDGLICAISPHNANKSRGSGCPSITPQSITSQSPRCLNRGIHTRRNAPNGSASLSLGNSYDFFRFIPVWTLQRANHSAQVGGPDYFRRRASSAVAFSTRSFRCSRLEKKKTPANEVSAAMIAASPYPSLPR